MLGGKTVNGSDDFKINFPGYAGPFCWCKNSENGFYSSWGYCTVKTHNPDQINLQISEKGSLVINFITFCSDDGINESCLDNNTYPKVEYKRVNDSIIFNKTGITHHYSTRGKLMVHNQ